MTVLHIEHKIQSFDGWKKVFDSDPINRKQSGVTHYRIYRPIDDPNFVVIDLEFKNIDDAQNTLAALQKVWGQMEGSVIMSPQARIMDIVESSDLL